MPARVGGPEYERLAAEVELTASVLALKKFLGGSSHPVSDVVERFVREKGWPRWRR